LGGWKSRRLIEADALGGIVVSEVEKPDMTKVKLGVIVAILDVTAKTQVTVSLLVDAYDHSPLPPVLVQKATPSLSEQE